ncbi:MAG TPA: nucleoside-diphosphate sugar epimerase/dehydratase [Paralcaligenes sp.]|jgi:FlaA1/EpsC-like NDP-sugar epimerase
MSFIVTPGKPAVTPLMPIKAVGIREYLLALSRKQKRVLQLSVDTLLIWFALWLAFYLRFGDAGMIRPAGGHAWIFVLAPILALPIFARLGLYRAVVHCLGYQALAALALAITASSILLACAVYLYVEPPDIVPRSIVFIYWMLCLLLIGGLRIAMRQYFGHAPLPHLNTATLFKAKNKNFDSKIRVVIYGAGAAGTQLLTALGQGRERHVVAFIDDDPQLTERVVAGVLVYASADLGRLVKETRPQEVLLAIPSAPRSRRAKIINLLAPYPLHVRTVPGLTDLASGRVKAEDLQEVNIADLLGRDPVKPNEKLFRRCIRDQTVMVTGAGGSIGSELCRQIISIGPRILILFEHSEFNLYSIENELNAYVRRTNLSVRIVPILSSVRNQKRLLNIMTIWKVDTVYHAAAYKHVPMVEHNVAEGIVNNVFGTLYCAQASVLAGVRHFVLISTDKAVRPTNIMGGTKRLSELVLQALAEEPMPSLYGRTSQPAVPNRTRFTMVRFGNVLDSSGSVIPLFRRQIRAGGPVTVTHPEITRYFMTIPEAAQLVIQAGAMGKGGDVFVLDMGEPIKIAELAQKMILLSGLSIRSPGNKDGDIAIEFVGLRPGEKLYEELLIGDSATATDHPMIMRASEKHLDWATLKISLTEIAAAVMEDDYLRVRELFCQLIDGYTPSADMADWIHQQQMTIASQHAPQRPLKVEPADVNAS